MKFSAPVPLDRVHNVSGFDSGKPVLDEWLARHALQSQASGSAKTFVILEGGRVIAYFSLTVGQVDTFDAPERVRKGMGRFPIPVVILARMAVDKTTQGKGLGRGMLQESVRRTLLISDQAGIRALLTHPIDEDAESFYLRFGFIPSPIREKQLILLLKDAKKLRI